MELIYSTVLPVRFPKTRNFRDTFEEQLRPADEILISTGYVSEDSLMELKSVLDFYKKKSQEKKCDLVIGMHGREGFTRSQYEAAYSLGGYLRDEKLGEVRVCTAFKFHGKVYSFLKHDRPFASIIGSSNLSGILGMENQWEADTLLSEVPMMQNLVGMHKDLVLKATKPLLDLRDIKIVSSANILEGRIGVQQVSTQELEQVRQSKTNIMFSIPLKAEVKSNLNVYFGKGRESQTGSIRPRAWYEVEIVVQKSITSQRGYPTGSFVVVTDDGWKFRCKISGQNNKNLRSQDDLQTLGRWIKGRMEASGKLKVGDLITLETLESYGTDKLLLTATKDPEVWLLDFSSSK